MADSLPKQNLSFRERNVITCLKHSPQVSLGALADIVGSRREAGAMVDTLIQRGMISRVDDSGEVRLVATLAGRGATWDF